MEETTKKRPKVNFNPEAWVAIGELKHHPKNPRIDLREDKKRFDSLKKSIQAGVFEAIKVSRSTGYCLAGNQRLKAYADLGYEEVPVQYNDCFDEAEELEIIIKDNNEWGAYDYAALKEAMGDLPDLGSLGFNDLDLAALKKLEPNNLGAGEEDGEITPPAEPKTKLGDMYQLGPHRLICGDCTDNAVVDILLDGEVARILVTDPPYGVDYSAKNNAMASFRPNKNKHADIENDTKAELKDFFFDFLANLKGRFSNVFYIFMSSQELHNLRLAIEECGYKWSDYLVWAKQHFVLGRKDYNSKHEFIAYGWQDTHKFYGASGSSTIIEFDRPMSSKEHPTMKPIGLIEKLIVDGCEEGDLVLDVFGGSGTTLLAAENTKRVCRMIELQPAYCDVIIDRWEKLTGRKAELVCARVSDSEIN